MTIECQNWFFSNFAPQFDDLLIWWQVATQTFFYPCQDIFKKCHLGYLLTALDMRPDTLDTLATSFLWLQALLRATTAPLRPVCGSYSGLLFITTLLHIHRALKTHTKLIHLCIHQCPRTGFACLAFSWTSRSSDAWCLRNTGKTEMT